MVTKLTKEEFLNLKDEIILIDMYADWCGPCKMMAPFLLEASEDATLSNVKFFKVNVDEESELAAEFGISAIPTFIILKNKQEIARRMGFIPKVGLTNWIKESIK